MITTPSLQQQLFCKPLNPSIQTTVWSKFYDQVKGTIQLKTLNLQTELPIIHEWVNQEYALQYWQMNGHYSQLMAIYQCMEFNPFAQSFTGYWNGNLICQFDLYAVAVDELKHHIVTKPTDCGFHLLMAPVKNPIHGLTVTMIRAFLEFYFSFEAAVRMYAEPDVYNLKSIQLLERAGFIKQKTVTMSYKTAHIYLLEKHQ